MDVFEQHVCDCIEEKFDSVGVDFKAEMLKFEDYLIDHEQLRDKSGSSYYNVFQQIAKKGIIPVYAEYPINGLALKSFKLYSECFYAQKNNSLLFESDSKLAALYNAFSDLSGKGNFYASSVAEEIIKVLKPEDFDKEIYRLYALHTFYHAGNTAIPVEKESVRYFASIYINNNHEVFLNGNLTLVDSVVEKINDLKIANSVTNLDTVNIRLSADLEVSMLIISKVKNELKDIGAHRLYYIMEDK